MAPLGTPVVPLVYWIAARSSHARPRIVEGSSGPCAEQVRPRVVPGAGAGELGRAGLPGPGDRQSQGQPLRPGHRRRDVDGDDVLDPGRARRRVAATLSQATATVAAVVAELVGHLGRRVERVVLDDDGAEPEHRVERDDVLGAVRQHDRHPVARADPEPSQTLRPPCAPGARARRRSVSAPKNSSAGERSEPLRPTCRAGRPVRRH